MKKRFYLPFEKPFADLEQRLRELLGSPSASVEEIRAIRKQLDELKRKVYSNLTAWETVLVARHPERPQSADHIELICEEFVELHGDRSFGDDRAIVAGIARIGDYKVMLIGHQKGKNIKERGERFFGCAHPEGYRKALEKMRLAAKFSLPIICMIDTPGAYPGIGAEERGQAQKIAENIRAMSQLPVPIVCTVIGEGGSGGALGIGIGNRVSMLEFAYYSVISPEGCSGILWKDGDGHKEQAAEALRLTSKDLKRLGVIDEVVLEPLGGAHDDHRATAASLKTSWIRHLRELGNLGPDELIEERYQKFRRMGEFLVAGV